MLLDLEGGVEDVFASSRPVEIRPGRRVRLLHIPASRRTKCRVLLTHGAASSMTIFKEQVRMLASRGDVDVLTYDWVGCAGSAKPRDPSAYLTDELFKDLHATYRMLLGTAKDDTPIMVVGHSFGASLVVRLAAADPDQRLAAIVLISCSSDGSTLKEMAQVYSWPDPVLSFTQPLLTMNFNAKAFHRSSPKATVKEAASIFNANEIYVLKAMYSQWQWTTTGVAQKVKVPALCIHGEEDQVIPTLDGEKFAGYFTNAVFRRVADSSHMPTMEEPYAVNTLLGQAVHNIVRGRSALRGMKAKAEFTV